MGGSTADSAELARWCDTLEKSDPPLIIVPGGGPFADHVRDDQKRLGFSEKAAHAMAILAMEQFAQLILERSANFRAVRSLTDIERAFAGATIPVWLPSQLALQAPNIRESWDVTSDSLAAWLAGRTGADTLLLIKQTDDFSAQDSLETLSARGIIDAALPSMLPGNVELYLAGPLHAASAAKLLASGQLPGIRIFHQDAPALKSG
nr:dihydroneopterin aldolase [Pseudaminobacter soli]